MSDHTFGSQSGAWLEGLRTRKRRPVAPSSLDTYRSRLRSLIPIVGTDILLRDIHNGFLKELASKLPGSAKTVNELLAVVKAVIASAVDPQTGEPLYPRTWNHSFIDAPTICGQKQPCATTEEVNRAIKNATNHQEQLLYAVLSGAGHRIAEALSIHVAGAVDQTSWNESTATITVRSSIYNGAEQHRVKTQAGNRVVDLDPRLNAAIIEFVAEQNIQPGTFLFQSKSGRAMHLRTATARLKKHGIHGFHAFRRFRISRLRELGCPEDIIRFWAGHAGQGITDRYSKLGESVALRMEWATRVGLGFSLEHIAGPAGAKRLKKLTPTKIPPPEKIVNETPTPSVPKAKFEKNGISQTYPKKHNMLQLAQGGADIQPDIQTRAYVATADDLDSFFEQPAPTQDELDAERARIHELREMVEGAN